MNPFIRKVKSQEEKDALLAAARVEWDKLGEFNHLVASSEERRRSEGISKNCSGPLAVQRHGSKRWCAKRSTRSNPCPGAQANAPELSRGQRPRARATTQTSRDSSGLTSRTIQRRSGRSRVRSQRRKFRTPGRSRSGRLELEDGRYPTRPGRAEPSSQKTFSRKDTPHDFSGTRARPSAQKCDASRGSRSSAHKNQQDPRDACGPPRRARGKGARSPRLGPISFDAFTASQRPRKTFFGNAFADGRYRRCGIAPIAE